MTNDQVLEQVLQLVSAAADDDLSADDQAELNRMFDSLPEAREFKA